MPTCVHEVRVSGKSLKTCKQDMSAWDVKNCSNCFVPREKDVIAFKKKKKSNFTSLTVNQSLQAPLLVMCNKNTFGYLK